VTRTDGGFRLFGLGAAACVACCAGPILALLGSVGLAGVASTAVIGGAGLLVTALAIAAYLLVRRRPRTCAVPASAVLVDSPVRRAPEPTEAP
jgi:mercuric ion transport protein